MRALKIMLRAWFCLAITLYRLHVQLQDELDQIFHKYFSSKNTGGTLFERIPFNIHVYILYMFIYRHTKTSLLNSNPLLYFA